VNQFYTGAHGWGKLPPTEATVPADGDAARLAVMPLPEIPQTDSPESVSQPSQSVRASKPVVPSSTQLYFEFDPEPAIPPILPRAVEQTSQTADPKSGGNHQRAIQPSLGLDFDPVLHPENPASEGAARVETFFNSPPPWPTRRKTEKSRNDVTPKPQRSTPYTGKSGWGKIDKPAEPPAQEEGFVVQRTLFSLFKHEQLPDPDFPPTVSDHLRKKPKPSRSKVKQRYLDFDDENEFSLLYPEYPGFTPIRAQLPIEPAQFVTLPDGRAVPVPATFAELRERFGLWNLAPDSLHSIPGQLEALTTAFSRTDNLPFYGPTGCGKTFIAMAIAARELAAGNQVVIFAPTEALAKQHAVLARSLFSIPDDYPAVRTGAISPADRAALYRQIENNLIIATPEGFLNDLRAQKVILKKLSLVIFDEAHLARGGYAYRQIVPFFPASVRLIAFSGTLAKDADSLRDFLKYFGMADPIPIRIPEQRRFEKPVYLQITPEKNPDLYEASRSVFNGMIKKADEFQNALARACEYSYGLRPEYRLLVSFRKATRITEVNRYRRGERLLEPHTSVFRMPDYEFFQELGRALHKGNVGKRFGVALSVYYQLDAFMRLYAVLTCGGQFAFDYTVAKRVWQIRFGSPGEEDSSKRIKGKDEAKNFHKRVYGSHWILRPFAELTAESPFFLIQSHTSDEYEELEKKIFPDGLPEPYASWRVNPRAKIPEKKLTPANENDPEAIAQREKEIQLIVVKREKKIRAFALKTILAQGRAFFISRDYVDHPQEQFIRTITQRHCAFGSVEQQMIYDESSTSIQFHTERLNKTFSRAGIEAVPVVGKKHLTPAQRDANLDNIRSKEVQVLGANSAANTGLDIPGLSVLIRLSHTPDPFTKEQTDGRIGRRGGFAYIYNVMTLGTVGVGRYYAGLHKRKTMRQAVLKIRRIRGIE
jgi:hypothetical protein